VGGRRQKKGKGSEIGNCRIFNKTWRQKKVLKLQDLKGMGTNK